jgi:predicted 3-demethylubiquinone-9 3-methyltransferase (glyoxalase superfamily)
MQKITPFLWFDQQAEEAVQFYLSIFPNAAIKSITRFGEGGPMPAGTVLTIAFELEGLNFVALNGGPKYSFTPAVSFVVSCNEQAEIDYYWNSLSEGGQTQACGWLTDKYGLCWQIVPPLLVELLQDSDTLRSSKAMQAMLQMTKIDIAALKAACG